MVLKDIPNIFESSNEDIEKVFSKRTEQIIISGSGENTETFVEGTTIDTAVTPANITLTIPTKTELTGDSFAFEVSYNFSNRSGATDLFSYKVENTTRGITLISETNVSVGNGDGVGDDVIATYEKGHREGDTIRLRFTNGVLGTATGQPTFGYLKLDIANMVLTEKIKVSAIEFEQV